MTKKIFLKRLLPNANANELNSIYLGGHLEKSFYWLDDRKDGFLSDTHRKIEDSMFLGELYTALLDQNCSYLTYFRDSLLEDAPENRYYPGVVSCLVKELWSDSCYFGEVAGSRIANLMQQPTVYNFGANLCGEIHEWKQDHFVDKKFEPHINFLISIDFVPWNHRILTLEAFDIYCDNKTTIQSVLKQIDETFPQYAIKLGINPSKENLEKFKSDLVKQFLFRDVVSGDKDYEEKNIIILIDEFGNISLGPNLDMEYMFQENNAKDRSLITKINMDFLCANYPNEVLEVLSLANKAYKSGKIFDIIDKTPKSSPFDSIRYKKVIKENIAFMSTLVKENYKNVIMPLEGMILEGGME